MFGKPIAGYQLTQQKLAEMALEINRGLARRAPPRPDEGRRARSAPSTSASGRWGTSAARSRSARSARTILGANGVTLEYPVIRHVNNLESVLTYEGTHEVHTLVVGQALTGENSVPLGLAVPVLGVRPLLRGSTPRRSSQHPGRFRRILAHHADVRFRRVRDIRRRPVRAASRASARGSARRSRSRPDGRTDLPPREADDVCLPPAPARRRATAASGDRARTISHSSFAWWVRCGQADRPASSSYRLPADQLWRRGVRPTQPSAAAPARTDPRLDPIRPRAG